MNTVKLVISLDNIIALCCKGRYVNESKPFYAISNIYILQTFKKIDDQLFGLGLL